MGEGWRASCVKQSRKPTVEISGACNNNINRVDLDASTCLTSNYAWTLYSSVTRNGTPLG